MSGRGNTLWRLLLVLCVRFVLLVEQTGGGNGTSATMSAEVNSTTVGTTAATKVVPTNASFATTSSTYVTTCNANDSSCTTVTKSTDVVAGTTMTTPKNATFFTTLNPATTPKNATTSSTLKASTTLKNATTFTTLKPSTTSAPTTPMPQIEIELEDFNSDVCTCDLQRHFCDINCCCDKDCSFEDKMVFKSCKRETNLHRDTSFCQYMDYIYLNNTPYKWEVNQNGLFCIAKSNLPARYTVQKKEPITTLEDAELQKQNKYSWPDINDKQALELKFNTTENFKFGSNIWMLKNHSLELFQLPDNFITNACLIKKNMKFLQNFKTKCSQTWINEDNPSLNAGTYFNNISIVRAPRYLNISSFGETFQNCSTNVCLPIEAKMCNENYENCIRITNNDQIRASCHLSIINNENSCFNLTQKVKYNFYHNGTRGFTKIELFLVLRNISYYFREENYEFPQQFEVNYFWSNYSFSYSSLMSGNPGYLILKPILIGNMVKILNTTNSTNSNKTDGVRFKIERNPSNIADNFLILPSNKKGLCVLNNSTHVLLEFGYNMILKCKIKETLDLENKNLTASNLCVRIQKTIFDFWPISKTNLSDINKVVGNFGNANESVLTDWTKILSNKTPGQILNETSGNFRSQNTTLHCGNIVSNLRIDIFHARVDFKDLRNQEKILGVSYHFGKGRNLEFDLLGGDGVFEVVIREEVMFFDITSERIQKFVDPPTFTISLPYDFFYPFVKVGNKGSCVCFYNIFIFGVCVSVFSLT